MEEKDMNANDVKVLPDVNSSTDDLVDPVKSTVDEVVSIRNSSTDEIVCTVKSSNAEVLSTVKSTTNEVLSDDKLSSDVEKKSSKDDVFVDEKSSVLTNNKSSQDDVLAELNSKTDKISSKDKNFSINGDKISDNILSKKDLAIYKNSSLLTDSLPDDKSSLQALVLHERQWRRRAEDWASFLERELDAHIDARHQSDIRYFKLMRKMKVYRQNYSKLRQKCNDSVSRLSSQISRSDSIDYEEEQAAKQIEQEQMRKEKVKQSMQKALTEQQTDYKLADEYSQKTKVYKTKEEDIDLGNGAELKKRDIANDEANPGVESTKPATANYEAKQDKAENDIKPALANDKAHVTTGEEDVKPISADEVSQQSYGCLTHPSKEPIIIIKEDLSSSLLDDPSSQELMSALDDLAESTDDDEEEQEPTEEQLFLETSARRQSSLVDFDCVDNAKSFWEKKFSSKNKKNSSSQKRVDLPEDSLSQIQKTKLLWEAPSAESSRRRSMESDENLADSLAGNLHGKKQLWEEISSSAGHSAVLSRRRSTDSEDGQLLTSLDLSGRSNLDLSEDSLSKIQHTKEMWSQAADQHNISLIKSTDGNSSDETSNTKPKREQHNNDEKESTLVRAGSLRQKTKLWEQAATGQKVTQKTAPVLEEGLRANANEAMSHWKQKENEKTEAKVTDREDKRHVTDIEEALLAHLSVDSLDVKVESISNVANTKSKWEQIVTGKQSKVAKDKRTSLNRLNKEDFRLKFSKWENKMSESSNSSGKSSSNSSRSLSPSEISKGVKQPPKDTISPLLPENRSSLSQEMPQETTTRIIDSESAQGTESQELTQESSLNSKTNSSKLPEATDDNNPPIMRENFSKEFSSEPSDTDIFFSDSEPARDEVCTLAKETLDSSSSSDEYASFSEDEAKSLEDKRGVKQNESPVKLRKNNDVKTPSSVSEPIIRVDEVSDSDDARKVSAEDPSAELEKPRTESSASDGSKCDRKRYAILLDSSLHSGSVSSRSRVSSSSSQSSDDIHGSSDEIDTEDDEVIDHSINSLQNAADDDDCAFDQSVHAQREEEHSQREEEHSQGTSSMSFEDYRDALDESNLRAVRKGSVALAQAEEDLDDMDSSLSSSLSSSEEDEAKCCDKRSI